MRVIGEDLDDQLQLALTAGQAEAAAYLGRAVDDAVPDQLMGTLYLSRSPLRRCRR